MRKLVTWFVALWVCLLGAAGLQAVRADGLNATYWDNADFTGTSISQVDANVNFSWGTSGPAAGFGSDTFSARWTGYIKPAYSQTYTFYVGSDDGCRLWVNNVLIVDSWVAASGERTGTISLTANTLYSIKLEYFENTGWAYAYLAWSSSSLAKEMVPSTALFTTQNVGSGDGLSGTYWDNADFTGTSFTRVDPTVNFSWANAGPASSFGSDTFSARWTGQIKPAHSETYTFYVGSDDGCRLWVNNVLLIDSWVAASGERTGTISLTANTLYSIKLEYFENTGWAYAYLAWSSASQAKQMVPTSALFSSGGSGGSGGMAIYGVNLAGAEFGSVGPPATTFPGVYNQDYSYPTAAELDYYKSCGRRLVRLPFRWERVQPTLNSALDSTEMGRMDVFINDASTRGMLVLLDCHNYGRYNIGGSNEQVLGSAQLPNSAFADLWKRIAQRYAGRSAIYGYGLMNEPHDMGDAARWPAAAQAAVNGIRTVDTTHAIFVAGDAWSGAWSWRISSNENLDIQDTSDNIVYEAHQYFDSNSSGVYSKTYDQEMADPNFTPQSGVLRAQPFVEWCIAKGKRGFMGEFGIPDDDPRWNTMMNNFLAYLNAHNISGTYWAGGPRWPLTERMSIEPKDNLVTDRPQMAVLKNYPGG